MHDTLLFIFVGFFAQLIDGALGLAYGVISMTVLLGMGVPPVAASASIHTAEVFTTGISGASHGKGVGGSSGFSGSLGKGGVSGGCGNGFSGSCGIGDFSGSCGGFIIACE